MWRRRICRALPVAETRAASRRRRAAASRSRRRAGITGAAGAAAVERLEIAPARLTRGDAIGAVGRREAGDALLVGLAAERAGIGLGRPARLAAAADQQPLAGRGDAGEVGLAAADRTDAALPGAERRTRCCSTSAVRTRNGRIDQASTSSSMSTPPSLRPRIEPAARELGQLADCGRGRAGAAAAASIASWRRRTSVIWRNSSRASFQSIGRRSKSRSG